MYTEARAQGRLLVRSPARLLARSQENHWCGMLAEDLSTSALKRKCFMPGQSCYDIQNPTTKESPSTTKPEKGNTFLKQPEKHNSSVETIPKHQPGSLFFQSPPLLSKPRCAFGEGRVVRIPALKGWVWRGRFTSLTLPPFGVHSWASSSNLT